MKLTSLLFISGFLFPLILSAQVSTIQIDSCGLDTDKLLNSHEAAYFNAMIQAPSFDFENKKVAFAYAYKGKKTCTKKDYFRLWGRNYYVNGHHIADQIIILTTKEKLASGYDVIVVSWSKSKIKGKNRKEVVKRFMPK